VARPGHGVAPESGLPWLRGVVVAVLILGAWTVAHRIWRNAQLRDCAHLKPFVQQGALETIQVAFLSDGLKIGALLTKPLGPGPFPAYIHNHGALTRTHASDPLWNSPDEIDSRLAAAGYVVMRPARRGYLGSEGSTTTYWVQGSSLSAAEVIQGAYAEAQDVEAAITYVQGCPFVSPRKIAIGGHSVGGLVTVIAATRRRDLAAVVSVNGGITWIANGVQEGYPAVSRVWREEAKNLTAPILLLHGKGDSTVTPELSRELAELLQRRSVPVTLNLYEGGHYPFPVDEIVKYLDAQLGRGQSQ
jgi:dienelactone hydrolase